VEVPVEKGGGQPAVPQEYTVRSATKSATRYIVNHITNVLLPKLEEAEAALTLAKAACVKKVYKRFAERRGEWRLVVACVAEIDLLQALASCSVSSDGLTMSRQPQPQPYRTATPTPTPTAGLP